MSNDKVEEDEMNGQEDIQDRREDMRKFMIGIMKTTSMKKIEHKNEELRTE